MIYLAHFFTWTCHSLNDLTQLALNHVSNIPFGQNYWWFILKVFLFCWELFFLESAECLIDGPEFWNFFGDSFCISRFIDHDSFEKVVMRLICSRFIFWQDKLWILEGFRSVCFLHKERCTSCLSLFLKRSSIELMYRWESSILF